MHKYSFFGAGAMLFMVSIGGVSTPYAGPPTPEHHSSVLLQSNLGTHSYPISTSNPLAQRYFDQGLILSFGFNHAEAARSFQEAQRLDPTCAMCFWGEALVLGPNINAPMDDSVVPPAYAVVLKAQALANDASDAERGLIRALTQRYSSAVLKDRSSLDQAYADAMRALWKRYPADATIGSLFAEALMDLHPWNFWTKTGDANPWTPEIIITLETVLNRFPDHPLANHLYIHAIEASPTPERALPSAERLATLVPGSGHLVHMPAHIYLRVGRYADAMWANQHAVAVDQQYLSHNHAEGIYTLAYVPHNFHFLWAAAIKTGQHGKAMQAAINTAKHVDSTWLRNPGLAGTMQHFLIMPLYTQALFGQWNIILQNAKPPEDLRYSIAIWHYARGLALTRLSQTASARKELLALQEIRKDPVIAGMTIFALNPISKILMVAEHVLAAEIAAQDGDFQTALTQARAAVEVEDGLNYTEPEDWYLPCRQVLGALLLESGDGAKAEQVFREDLRKHPQSGWSLYGLMRSLQGQGKTELAEKVQKRFEAAWADADVVLTNSRF